MNEGMENLKESEDMLLLLEQHKKEIWEWKRKESKWLEDRVLLDGTKKLDEKNLNGWKIGFYWMELKNW